MNENNKLTWGDCIKVVGTVTASGFLASAVSYCAVLGIDKLIEVIPKKIDKARENYAEYKKYKEEKKSKKYVEVHRADDEFDEE